MLKNLLYKIKEKMKIGLIQVDGKWPNIALMRLSAWHKQRGDDVTLLDMSNFEFDRVYASKIFIGGSGVDLKSELPPEIEAIVPDYELFKKDYSMGFTSRGCIRDCGFCIVREKEGYIHEVSLNWIQHQKVIVMDNNFLASPKWKEKLQFFIDKKLKICFNQGLDIRLITEENAELLAKIDYRDSKFKNKRLYFAFDNPKLEPLIRQKIELLARHDIKSSYLLFYVLIGFNTTFEEDYQRFKVLDDLKAKPFIMVYNNSKDKQLRNFARWVNQRYYKVVPFEKYNPNYRSRKEEK